MDPTFKEDVYIIKFTKKLDNLLALWVSSTSLLPAMLALRLHEVVVSVASMYHYSSWVVGDKFFMLFTGQ